jgi:hypothetical protein
VPPMTLRIKVPVMAGKPHHRDCHVERARGCLSQHHDTSAAKSSVTQQQEQRRTTRTSDECGSAKAAITPPHARNTAANQAPLIRHKRPRSSRRSLAQAASKSWMNAGAWKTLMGMRSKAANTVHERARADVLTNMQWGQGSWGLW